MFVQCNVSEIQQLSKSYRRVISTTKTDLHNLVSAKYRDLIKIAEDISDINQKTLHIDTNLQELSSKPSTFVSPYNNQYHMFDTIVRRQYAKTAQLNSRHIIVKNLLKNKLGKLKNTIASGFSSPILYTSSLIHFVKLLYTIEVVFQDVLQSKKEKDLKSQVESIKGNLKTYLEFEISAYNVSESIFTSSDKFNTKQRTIQDNFILKTSLSDLSSLVDEMEDASLETYDDADDDSIEKGNNFDDDLHTTNDSVGKNSSALCNYLVSYTMLMSITDSEEVKHCFFELRIKYLLNALIGTNGDLVNQYQVLKYLENTCLYIETYFDNGSSDYYKTLQALNVPWAATAVLSYRDWYEDAVVKLKAVTNANSITEKSTEGLFERVSETVSNIINFAGAGTEGDDTNKTLPSCIIIFIRFITSLRRIKETSSVLGKNSKIVQITSKHNTVSRLFSNLTAVIKECLQKHLARLNSENGIWGTVQGHLESCGTSTDTLEPLDFRPETVNLMDYDIDTYMEQTIAKKGSQRGSNNSSTDAIWALRDWLACFDNLKQIIALVDAAPTTNADTDNAPAEVDFVPTTDIYHALLPLCQTLKKENLKWGDFSASVIEENFRSMTKDVETSLKREMIRFVTNISNLENNRDNIDQLIQYVGLLTSLKSASASISNIDIVDKIDSVCESTYSKIMDKISEKRLDVIIELAVIKALEIDNSADTPTRPILSLASEIFSFAQELLKFARVLRSSDAELFSKTSTLNIFVTVKNNWLKEQLFNNKLEKALKKLSSEKDKMNRDKDDGSNVIAINNDLPNKLAPSKALQLLANLHYLSLFYSTEPLDLHAQSELILGLCDEEEVGNSKLEAMRTGVEAFYKSRKNLYLPLSLSL
ncbi:hypothetical protein KGF56_001437 [Candida oxycetoniae]|uniref:Uncharacterized protein n=1 Tax=Candida oxycetoniae TaxID=497107 RepID=A0AAI9WZE5_9ASCO|nr:uncharacterized protein KGF56_001437 [Candida oxycetoniae]KAI3405830.2 hypothetical protein KGF56_001437 [Candida oxycetoniae]